MNIELSPETESNIIGGQPYTPIKPELSENENKGLLYGSLIAAGIHAAAGGLRGGLGEAAIQGLAGGFSSYASGQDELYKQKKNEEANRIQWQRQRDLVNYKEAMQTLNQQRANDQNMRFYDNQQRLIDKAYDDLAAKKKALETKQKDPLTFRDWQADYLKTEFKLNALQRKSPDMQEQVMNPNAIRNWENSKAELEAQLKWMEEIGKERFPNFFKNKPLTPEEQQRKTQQDINKTTKGIFERATQGQQVDAATTTPAQSETPPITGARKAPDGFWYIPDPDPKRQGKYLRYK